MAKQVGLFKITGTIDDITFYEMNGNFYCKRKSSISKSRFRNHSNFALVRKNASLFGEASKLASKIYRTYSKAERINGVFSKLTGLVYKKLKAGELPENILKSLTENKGTLIKMYKNEVKTSKQKKKSRMLYITNPGTENSIEHRLVLTNALLEAIKRLPIAI